MRHVINRYSLVSRWRFPLRCGVELMERFLVPGARVLGTALFLISLLSGHLAIADPQTSVTVDLSGVTFRSGLNQMVSSSPNALIAVPNYTYSIQGSVHGSGPLITQFIPNSPSTPIGTALDMIEPGLSGITHGPVKSSGKFPFVIFQRSVSNQSIGGGLNISLTFEAQFDAAGFADFSLTNVLVTASTPFGSFNDTTDELIFDAGSTLTVTAVLPPPVAVTRPASAIDNQSATLNGTVDPMGTANGVAFFEYGRTVTYGATTSVQQLSGSSGQMVVSAGINGLMPHTAYHFRITGSDANGIGHGKDQTFTTLFISPDAVGPYDGFITTSGTAVGFLRGMVNSNGTFTGSMTVDGAVHAIKGSFVLSGSLNAAITRPMQPPLL